jgi:Secretion system C-terminal sorting domain
MKSGLLIIVTLMHLSLNAQIVYTDVIPDSSIVTNGGTPVNYLIDLNTDGVNDFQLSVATFGNSFGGASYTTIVALDSNMIISDSAAALNTHSLSVTDSINATSPFYLGSGLFFNMSFSGGTTTLIGNWQNYGYASYCGVKFYGNGQWYYGWILISVEVSVSYSKITVHEWAYSTDPMVAGDGSPFTSIDENGEISSYTIYPNPATDKLWIKNKGGSMMAPYSILDQTGRTIVTNIVNNEVTFVDIQTLPAGKYYLHIEDTITSFVVK